MNEVHVNTLKMREMGNDILEQVELLKGVIDAMFSRINDIPITTLEWVGDSANEFAVLAEKDKVQYVNYANDLYKYGKYLIDCADYMDKTIKEIRRENI